MNKLTDKRTTPEVRAISASVAVAVEAELSYYDHAAWDMNDTAQTLILKIKEHKIP